MTVRVRFALAGWVALTLLCAAGAVAVAGRGGEVDAAFALLSLWLAVALGGVGALLLALRPGNLLGPVLAVAGTALGVEYAVRALVHAGDGATTAAERTLAWFALLLDPLFFPAALVLTLVLFPGGRLPPWPWRAVVPLVLAVTAVQVALLALRPGPLPDETFHAEIPWDGALPASAAGAVTAVQDAAGAVLSILLVAAGAGLAVRFARARGEARRQLAPLVLVVGVAVAGLALQVAGLRAPGVALLVGGVALGLPAALAVGALRYRLWDLDRVVVAAIVYGGLALFVTAAYVAVVAVAAAVAGRSLTGGTAGSGGGSLAASVVATAVATALFAPVRDRLTRAARRLVLGVRATPYEALAVLPRRLADSFEVDDVLPDVAAALSGGLGVPAARVRAFLDDGSRRVAWSPADADRHEAELTVVPVRHLGREVGDVAVAPSPDRPLGEADRRLLADLAAQAGPALRGVGLTALLRGQLTQITAQAAQLAASRERLAAAQVGERRRLERDIHDGAQQQLVALAMHLEAAQRLASAGDPSAAELLARCREEAEACIDGLRELARGIYPPVLSARGLVPALRARARTSPGDVRVVAEPGADGRRFAAGVENAAYFCVLEALQNAAKHAPGTPVVVRVTAADGVLGFEVTDDGPGFTPGERAGDDGSGLVGMADRLAAVGGALAVESAPGAGTTVRGTIPVPAAP
jgi:signal transduction histidine kinase